MLLPLMGKCKKFDINDFVVGESLVSFEWRQVFNILTRILYISM